MGSYICWYTYRWHSLWSALHNKRLIIQFPIMLFSSLSITILSAMDLHPTTSTLTLWQGGTRHKAITLWACLPSPTPNPPPPQWLRSWQTHLDQRPVVCQRQARQHPVPVTLHPWPLWPLTLDPGSLSARPEVSAGVLMHHCLAPVPLSPSHTIVCHDSSSPRNVTPSPQDTQGDVTQRDKAHGSSANLWPPSSDPGSNVALTSHIQKCSIVFEVPGGWGNSA